MGSAAAYAVGALTGKNASNSDALAGVQTGEAATRGFRAANAQLRANAPRARQHHEERAQERAVAKDVGQGLAVAEQREQTNADGTVRPAVAHEASAVARAARRGPAR
ncbi:hypothetical protein CJ255_18955 [Candidatus Viridilinea mediisalina]|uniref:Uncharacterized protein n=1 Tax=Candidatus Viridilinea mediisalina TaxID=2024553 RepID=A0A2A6RF34_9CHLR|nr:hypothetical protein CJ255_18955 [Candidatus Viridilinea mediisalina]